MKMPNYMSSVILAVITLFAVSNLHATDSSWNAESKSYKVYLGAVSANLLKKKPYLIDRDKALHGGIGKQGSASKHIMVSVFRKGDHERVLDATVIGEIKHKKLIGGAKIRKPLEKMVTSGAITYGNFFNMTEKGVYKISIEIFESDKNGSEEVVFIQKN